MTVRKPNEKNTKAEILTAFNQLLEEKKSVESQLAQLAKEQKLSESKQVIEVKPVEEKRTMNSTLNGAGKQKIQQTIDSLANLQLTFGTAVSDLSEKLTLEAAKLQEIQQLVTTEIQELQELHNLEEIDDDTLDELITQYQQSAKAFAEEFSQRRETLEQEILEGKKAWTKEQEQQQRTIKERNETQTKTKLRDASEYKYELELQRKLNTDEYEQVQKALYNQLEELQQTQEKHWAEREKTISEREKQFEEYKTKVEAFPKELEAAVKKSKENGRGLGLYQTKVKADLRAKEVEGERRVYELRIQSLEETIQNQETRINNLAKQLDSALKQVQDLAVKAIEGSSNISSFQAVKEIALEQAKTKTNNK
ncbi:hypothetical protein IQ264_18675 [Phormidium sp. LEGE 05292]|uniref:hypothetical protein n=1 Tax=[Phormidium] sp. LEGE 05292 TaxID=767427 RepID=UPI00187DF266|nr:hypothetical protein [Phormidium sp. LEGE 05292]MBE9227456.1 hypothetical protein [Phormidium sp. LEGE 05292]